MSNLAMGNDHWQIRIVGTVSAVPRFTDSPRYQAFPHGSETSGQATSSGEPTARSSENMKPDDGSNSRASEDTAGPGRTLHSHRFVVCTIDESQCKKDLDANQRWKIHRTWNQWKPSRN